MNQKNEVLAKGAIKNEFELEKAFKLINQLVLRKNTLQQPELNVGRVAGVLTMNDEIEVVVKFLNEIMQFNKGEFDAEIEMLDD